MKHGTNAPLKTSPGNSPPRKKSKKDEVSVLFFSLSCKFTFLLQIVYMFQFCERVKDCENVKEMLVEALAIITDLEHEKVSRVIYSQYL